MADVVVYDRGSVVLPVGCSAFVIHVFLHFARQIKGSVFFYKSTHLMRVVRLEDKQYVMFGYFTLVRDEEKGKKATAGFVLYYDAKEEKFRYFPEVVGNLGKTFLSALHWKEEDF